MTWLQLEEIVRYEIESIGEVDDTFAEYILQLLRDNDMDEAERIEIILEFLNDSIGPTTEEEIKHIDSIVKEFAIAGAKLRNVVEVESLVQSLPALDLTRSDCDMSEKKGPQMTAEQREERERILAEYGYEIVDEIEDENGETELVKSEREPKKPVVENLKDLNSGIVREKELTKRLEMKNKFEVDKQRNKEDLAKQKLEKENKRKGTQKREKIRM